MRAVAVLLSGLATMVAGAFIRACDSAFSELPIELMTAWCGKAPEMFAATHSHCTGCALIAAGVGLVATSTLFMSRTTARPERARL